MAETMQDLARRTAETARRLGSKDVAVKVSRGRDVTVEWRDGKVDRVQDSTSKRLSVRLFVDGRYSSSDTCDFRPDAIRKFLSDAIEATRLLDPDPDRCLPDPSLYQGRSDRDLALYDPAIPALSTADLRRRAAAIEEDARSAPGADRILSVTTTLNRGEGESFLVHSNGFEGANRGASIWAYAETTVRGDGDRRPEDWSARGTRHLVDLPEVPPVGREAVARALATVGSRTIDSRAMTVVVENRAAGRLVGALLGSPLSASSLQQKRSFLEGRSGTAVGSEVLSVTDDPLLVRGFGSRLFDGEGIAARPLVLFDRGVLRNYYVDVYYGRKLGMTPTTGGASNLAWTFGTRNVEQMVAGLKDGLLITSFIGGNSNDTTGDFSFGIRGFFVKDGVRAHPVSEMNVTGSHLTLWKALVEAGNDPYLLSSGRSPSLLFDGVQVAGN